MDGDKSSQSPTRKKDKKMDSGMAIDSEEPMKGKLHILTSND